LFTIHTVSQWKNLSLLLQNNFYTYIFYILLH
jgi:hypothetical protein